MKLKNSRSPSLEEVLRMAVNQGLLDTHTALPGKVEKYDSAKQKADIKPLLKRTVINEDGSEISESLPVITDVPILFPRAGGFFISFPIQVGDFVLLVFCERSIDSYCAGNGTDTDPVDLRMHDLSDAVALPCFYPFKKSIKDSNGKDLVIGQDEGGSQIAVKNGGIVEISFDGGNTIKLENKDSSAKLTLGDGAKHVAIVEHLQSLYNSLYAKLTAHDAHVHPSGVGPTGTATILIQPDTWDPHINSTKVSIPDG
jgi:hypothetical protein